MCTPMLPSRRAAPVPESIPAGRLPSRPSTPVAALSGTTTVPAATPMRMKTPAITTLRYRCTGDGLDCKRNRPYKFYCRQGGMTMASITIRHLGR